MGMHLDSGVKSSRLCEGLTRLGSRPTSRRDFHRDCLSLPLCFSVGLYSCSHSEHAERVNQRRAFMRPLDLLVVRRRRFI